MTMQQVSLPIDSVLAQTGFNPRQYFDSKEQAELNDSVRTKGVLQPIMVRPSEEGQGKYWIIGGERRWRAARAVGLASIPAVIFDVDEREALRLSLDENLRRSDMSVAEEAYAARRALDLAQGDRAEALKRLGWNEQKFKARLALLHATEEVMHALMERRIKLGHAELLAALPESKQGPTLKTIIERKVSVDALEEQVKRVAIPLATAIFDTHGCIGCVHNSSTTLDLFGAHAPGAHCSNRACFEAKTEARLAELRTEQQKVYPVVFFDREKEPSSYTILEERGPRGVGPEQFLACKACKDFGALLSTAPGKQGTVLCDTTCFNLSCHAKKVQAYQAQLAEAERASRPDAEVASVASQTAALVNPTIKKKVKPKAQAHAQPAAVSDQYSSFACREASNVLARSTHGQQVMMTWALIEKCDSKNLADEVYGKDAFFESPARKLAVLWPKEDEALRALALVASQYLFKSPAAGRLVDLSRSSQSHTTKPQIPAHVTGEWVGASAQLLKVCDVQIVDFFSVDRALLEAHTKSGLEVLLTEAAFPAFYDAKHQGEKGVTFKALLAKKHGEIVEAVLASGFDFKGFVPGALNAHLAGLTK